MLSFSSCNPIKRLCVISTLCFSSIAFAKPITIEHLMGETQLEETPKRVVVIGMGTLDTIDNLGIKPISVSKGGTFPAYLQKYNNDNFASAGTIFEPDFEAIYMQKPDLIITGPRSSKHFKELSKIAPTYVYAIENGSDYWKETQQLWREMGEIFDKEDVVEEKISAISQDFTEIKEYNQQNNIDALMLMASGGNITSFGEGSRFSVLFQDFGFTPSLQVEDKAGEKTGGHGKLVSYELISQQNPNTLLILDRDKLVNKADSHTRENLDNDLIKSTQAYKNDRMKYLDISAWYVAGSGMTATEIMLKDIQSLAPKK